MPEGARLAEARFNPESGSGRLERASRLRIADCGLRTVIVGGVSEVLEDHLAAPSGRGRLRDAPHQGAAGGAPCGDLIPIRVRVEGDRVAAAGFDASGCGAAQAAGSAV